MEERSQSRGSSPSFSTPTTQDTHTAGDGRKLEGAKEERLDNRRFQFSPGGDWLERRPSSVARRDCWRLPRIRRGGSFYAEQHPRHASSPSLPPSWWVPCHARHKPASASHAQRAVKRPPRCSMPLPLWVNMVAEWADGGHPTTLFVRRTIIAINDALCGSHWVESDKHRCLLLNGLSSALWSLCVVLK